MKAHFRQLALYNRWANARLYEAVLELSDTQYRSDVGVFFRSLHGTLNHLLLTDRMWLKRLTGEGDHPAALDAILYGDLRSLAMARADEDERIIRYVDSLDDSSIPAIHRYANLSGKTFDQQRSDILTHIFNHQTHHRGQAHAALSICTKQEPPSLDLLVMQRGGTAPNIRDII